MFQIFLSFILRLFSLEAKDKNNQQVEKNLLLEDVSYLLPGKERIEKLLNKVIKSDQIESLVFIPKIPLRASDLNIIKLREIINDEFGGHKKKWDLQCTEYVCYKIKQMGVTINWPSDRPRHGGRWADIFERNKLYKITDDSPKIGFAMSFADSKFNPPYGHVAFVENIFNDGSIKISEANWPPIRKVPEGEYSERILPKAKWQNQYGGRFIDFSWAEKSSIIENKDVSPKDILF